MLEDPIHLDLFGLGQSLRYSSQRVASLGGRGHDLCTRNDFLFPQEYDDAQMV